MDAALAQLARSQGGVLTWGQVGDRNTAHRLLRGGEVVRVRRGVLGLASVPADRLRLAAAVLVTAADVVVSHESAAAVHGLPLLRPYAGPPVLSRVRPSVGPVPARQRVSPLASYVDPVDRVVLVGMPVTTAARTAVDLARRGSLAGGVVVVDAVLRAGLPRRQLEEVLARCIGWPGTRLAARAVELGDALAESPLESLVRVRLHEGGLPAPQLQVQLGGRYGPVARVDLLVERRVVVEADGMSKYADAFVLREEKLREDRLRDLGFEVVRVTWAEALHHPEILVSRVLRALARAESRAA